MQNAEFSNLDARSSLRDAARTLPLRYQSGIQTRHLIVAPPNIRYGGGAKTPVIQTLSTRR
ncbi:hypothetical protein [Nostoc sp. 'Peltigera membranacea cyanobiont' 210A]|uniref:hypothetical protein n=1 Tax=Nostoc sp. 'Peltigera membranacea cyanobiont' 210A TaxID=2014529 RepID=UPI001180A4B1|nr:hypothetical protein [Nostoc sp. 'Peltigera membranacea cyanobiont' 210A]